MIDARHKLTLTYAQEPGQQAAVVNRDVIAAIPNIYHRGFTAVEDARLDNMAFEAARYAAEHHGDGSTNSDSGSVGGVTLTPSTGDEAVTAGEPDEGPEVPDVPAVPSRRVNVLDLMVNNEHLFPVIGMTDDDKAALKQAK
jgi:hypothetical protein